MSEFLISSAAAAYVPIRTFNPSQSAPGASVPDGGTTAIAASSSAVTTSAIVGPQAGAGAGKGDDDFAKGRERSASNRPNLLVDFDRGTLNLVVRERAIVGGAMPVIIPTGYLARDVDGDGIAEARRSSRSLLV